MKEGIEAGEEGGAGVDVGDSLLSGQVNGLRVDVRDECNDVAPRAAFVRSGGLKGSGEVEVDDKRGFDQKRGV